MRTILWPSVARSGEAYHLAQTRLKAPGCVTLHTHDFCEIFWIEEGEGLHEINGERVRLKANHCALLQPSDAHAFLPLGPGLALINIAFPRATYDFLIARYFGSRDPDWARQGALPRLLLLTAPQRQYFDALARELRRAARTNLVLDRFLLNVLCELAPGEAGEAYPSCPEWLRRACEAIRSPEHFQEGPAGLARLTGRTPEHVARVLKATLGKTPGELVTAARMDYASGQLSSTSCPIIEISMNCGFSSLSHFYRIFRGRFGVSPRRYRMENQKVLPRRDG